MYSIVEKLCRIRYFEVRMVSVWCEIEEFRAPLEG